MTDEKKVAKKGSLAALLMTVFIDLVGVGVVIPVITPLFLNPAEKLLIMSPGNPWRYRILGFLLAAYPLAQFFGAPILGALADRFGRKKILMLSLTGTFFGYLLFAYGVMTNQLWLLFLGRALDGFTGGNISVAQSAIADVSDEKSKAKNFGLIGMAFGVGFVIGPYIGGKLADPNIVSWFSFSTPFWFVAGLTLLNIMLVWARFQETLKKKVIRPVSLFTGFHNIKRAMQLGNIRTVLLVVFLIMFGFNFFTQFFQVYLIENFHFTQSRIGDLFAFMGICIAIVQGGLTRPLSKKFSSAKILNVSILLLGLTLPFFVILTKSYMVYWVIPFVAAFNGLTQPNSLALLSNASSEDSQGEIMGINQSFSALAMAIPPIISGYLTNFSHDLPIIIGAGTTLLAWLVFVAFYRPQKKDTFTEA